MSKRVFSFILLFFGSVLLIGCNQVQELTEKETELIAEYAVGLLLKYDVNYINRIEEGTKEGVEEEDAQDIETKVQEDTETPITTEEDTQDISTGQNLDSKIDADNATKETDDSVGTEGDIAKIAGVSGVSITYKDYLMTNQYPATDEEGKIIYLEASNGYQLLVVCFNVKNTSGEVATISLIEKEINYRIVCNGNKAAAPMLTILMDDLGTLETTINPTEEQEAVLIFQISNDMKDNLERIECKIHYNDMDNVIKIL